MLVGKLINHGSAPYNNIQGNGMSYFITLNTRFGEKIVWGVGLEEALEDSSCQNGDNISIKHVGKFAVKVPSNRRGKKYEVKHRNMFEIKQYVPAATAPVAHCGATKNVSSKDLTFRDRTEKAFDNSIQNVLQGMLMGSVLLTVMYDFII